MSGSVAVIADSHLGGPGGPAGPLVEQLESLAGQGCRRLILLGDIFHVWVGSRRFETEEVRAVVPAIERLRADGIEVDYVEGNRDFFIGGGTYDSLFSRVGTEIAFEDGGRRYLAVHGDGLNDRDRQYLFWRWLSKSRLSRFLILNLPTAVARGTMGQTEARLSKTNFKHKTQIPEEAICSYGARRFKEGHDVLLLGHFHAPRTWQVEGGEIRLLDAWFNSRRVEWISNGDA